MTKKEARAGKEAWTKALAEGRVVRFDEGMSFRSFKSNADAQVFAASLPVEAKPEVLTVVDGVRQ